MSILMKILFKPWIHHVLLLKYTVMGSSLQSQKKCMLWGKEGKEPSGQVMVMTNYYPLALAPEHEQLQTGEVKGRD